MLAVGDPVPTLYSRSRDNPRYSLDSTAGRHVVLSFIGNLSLPGMADYYRGLIAQGSVFDDGKACCFIVTADPGDEQRGLKDRYPGIRILWDTDGTLARAFGCLVEKDGRTQIQCTSFVLDPGLRVSAVLPMGLQQSHFRQVHDHVSALPTPEQIGGTAPVLVIPNLLEPELCQAYIAYAREQGLEDSGFMRTDAVTGMTNMVVDHGHKKRADCTIADERLVAALQWRIKRRLVPQMERAFQFKATRIERYIVASYDGASGGWFRPHKDNTTLGTAHRRFAVSINLNAEDYEGGDLRFPEFGPRTYRPPTGGAVVFSCSLLHEATPITRGQRFCILPFLYDDAAAEVRLANAEYLADPALRDNVRQSVVTRGE